MAHLIPESTEREILRLYASGLGYKKIQPITGFSLSAIRQVILRGSPRTHEERHRYYSGNYAEWIPTEADKAEIEQRKAEVWARHLERKRKGEYVEVENAKMF